MEQYFVIGSPFGFRNQIFKASATQTGFADSRSLIAANGKGIYTTSIPIIALDATVYNGMSGAPLFNSSGSVVGIIVASLNVGGGLAWGIPSIQFIASIQNVPRSGKRPSQMVWREISSIAPEARNFSTNSRLSALETIEWLNSKWRNTGAKEIFINGFKAKIADAKATINDVEGILSIQVHYEFQGTQYRFLMRTQLKDAKTATALQKNYLTQRYAFRVDCPADRSCVSGRMEKLNSNEWRTLEAYERNKGTSEFWSFIDSDSAQRVATAINHLIHLNGGPIQKDEEF